MRGNRKCDRKTDFIEQLSFQLGQPYVRNRKLRGETKVLAQKMEFIDGAFNIMNLAVQGIKREDVTDVGNILALHAWFATEVFARNTKKYKKHILLRELNNL